MEESKPRFVIRNRNFTIKYDEAYMSAIEKELTLTNVNTQNDYLYVFLDEMGNETLPPKETLFGIGGCAFVGAVDKNGLNAEWQNLRRRVFKVPDDKPFHSNRHFKKLKAREHRIITNFLHSPDLRYFAAYIRTGAPVTWREDILHAVLSSIDLNINTVLDCQVKRAEYYFEHSYRLNPKLMVSTSQPMFRKAGENGGICFIPKSAMLPAIELADLISFIVGSALRKKGRDQTPYLDLMHTLFDDRQRGACEEVLGSIHAFIPAGKEGSSS